jgi:phosphatidylcholine synthase
MARPGTPHPHPDRAPAGAALAAWLVHLYTASGAVLGLLALLAVETGDFRRAFGWLVAATVVDASDGWLARRARVRDRAPQIDGARLDDVVDYLTYVFVPSVLIVRAGLLPAGWSWAVAAAVLLASAFGFSRTDAKSADHFFTGFPSYWNIVALYLYVAGWPAGVNAVILIVLAAMVFVPIGYVYPSRTPTLRPLTIALGCAWAVSVVAMIWTLPGVPGWLFRVSLVYPAYYGILSFILHGRRRE